MTFADGQNVEVLHKGEWKPGFVVFQVDYAKSTPDSPDLHYIVRALGEEIPLSVPVQDADKWMRAQ